MKCSCNAARSSSGRSIVFSRAMRRFTEVSSCSTIPCSAVCKNCPPRPARHPGRKGDIPLRDLRLVGVDRTAAKGEEDLFHLRRGQAKRLQRLSFPSQFLRGIYRTAHRKHRRTPHPQPHFLYLRRKRAWQLQQRTRQPARQSLDHLIILVHLPFLLPRLLPSLYAAGRKVEPPTQKARTAAVAVRAYKIGLYGIMLRGSVRRHAAWRGTLPPSAPGYPAPVPW